MDENKYQSPRPNQGSGKKNPFADDFGVQKESDSDQIQDSYHDTGSGWIPFSARDKRPIRQALWDNSQVPGSPYPGRDRSDGGGAPWNGEGEMIDRSDAKKYNPVQENWDHLQTPDATPKFPTKVVHRNNPAMEMNEIIQGKMETKMNFKKIAEQKEKRLNKVYSIEEDYAAYGRYCGEPTCVGVWKELLGFDQKRAMKIERESEVWRCPKCGKVTSAIGSVSEQTSGFSAFDTYSSGEPVDEKDGFKPVNEISPDPNRTKR